MTSQGQAYYHGESERLVIAIDVGTTFSRCSYALLSPGRVPQIFPITRFIGQREGRADSIVPSVVCYDRNGNCVAAGAQADPELNPCLEERDRIVRVEWLKLHLRPPTFDPEQRYVLEKLRSFPRIKTPVQVFGDMLRYLLLSAKECITDFETWPSIERNVHFVLSHPNNWEAKQQYRMRRAAILGGLVQNDVEAADRITFVTEGEASLHCYLNKIPSSYDKSLNGILIVDCGTGTIEVSAYSESGLSSRSFKEITSSVCIFEGSIFVARRAQKYFKLKLANSRYGDDQTIEAMTKVFDMLAQDIFPNPNVPLFVSFGGFRDNDMAFGIRNGKIKVPGTDVATFFEPSIKRIIKVIKEQCRISPMPIKTLFLVGDFARSTYLFSKLTDYFNSHNIKIFRADRTVLKKAVTDGAVSYYIDHFVSISVPVG